MTTAVHKSPLVRSGLTDEALNERYQPVFLRIAEGAAKRESERVLPFEQVEWLREAGFVALTVPPEFGGQGASITQLIRLLIELGEADSNVPQLLRAHYFVVEAFLSGPTSASRDHWLRTVADGAIFGNASHERSAATVGTYATKARKNEDGTWTLNGQKHYSTGSLFSDWVYVFAENADGGGVRLITSAKAPGVELVDDWDGFGQKLTASGTTIFNDVVVPGGAVFDTPPPGRTHMTAFAELVLLATLAGIGRAAVKDAATFVRSRTRTYSHAAAASPSQDPLIQQVVGRLSSTSYASEVIVLAAAQALEEAHDAIVDGDEQVTEAIDNAELKAVQAQLTVIELVLQLTTALFEVGGASATSSNLQLDRHWRNARTLASHNPSIYQARAIGDRVLNGADLLYSWKTGEQSPTG
jgi:alkylation response protein AidB-like acyl-CoA dehydrogenase